MLQTLRRQNKEIAIGFYFLYSKSFFFLVQRTIVIRNLQKESLFPLAAMFVTILQGIYRKRCRQPAQESAKKVRAASELQL